MQDLNTPCDYVFCTSALPRCSTDDADEKRLAPRAAPFEITQLTAADAEDAELVGRLVAMICEAFAASEGHGSAHGNIWTETHARTTAADTVEQIHRGEIFVARHRPDGPVVGTVRIVETDARSMYWGQLASSSRTAGQGLGRAMSAFVEQRARATGRSVVTVRCVLQRRLCVVVRGPTAL